MNEEVSQCLEVQYFIKRNKEFSKPPIVITFYTELEPSFYSDYIKHCLIDYIENRDGNYEGYWPLKIGVNVYGEVKWFLVSKKISFNIEDTE